MDELGIGMIRDAMSNKLFPGFSTLYTRAKYFFITPYILLDRDYKQRKNQTGKDYFQESEIKTNQIIINFYDSHFERASESYFGKEKRDGKLKRQPSEIYWYGMLFYHLLETNNSLDQLLTEKRSYMDELLSSNRSDDTTEEQGEDKKNKYVNVSFDKQWQDQISRNGLTLTRTEAETLRDRLIKHSPNSLPTALVTDERLWELYCKANIEAKKSKSIDNAFVHFVKSANTKISNSILYKNLVMAHDTALFLHGAHIAYNLRLWKKANAPLEYIEKIQTKGNEWLSTLSSRMLNYKEFLIDDCSRDTNLKLPTLRFLQNAQKLIYKTKSWTDIEEQLCDLAENQEVWNKKSKSRFIKMDKNLVIPELEKTQWLGLNLLNYRYHSALSIVNDIYHGLSNTEA